MSNVPFRNTDYVNNPIGNDRPIYGNELVPEGGCMPDGITRVMRFTDNQTSDSGNFYQMTDYSGGPLNSVYITAGSDGAAFRLHDNYIKNTEYNGVSYTAWQGDGPYSGGKMFFVFDTDGGGYRYYITSPLGTNTNPIYGGDYSGGLSLSYPNGLAQPIIKNGVGYPPLDLYSGNSFEGRFIIEYIGQECDTITPTPTISQGYLPTPTPTPTSSMTPTPSITPTHSQTPTPTITPTITPSPTNCSCLEYEVNNTSEFTQDTIGWLDCNQQSQEQTLAPGTILRICACAGSVESRGGVSTITLIGSCGLTPTPTPTQSITPTPSQVYAYRYEVSNCDDATDVRTFWSDDFYAVGKVVKGYNDVDKCFEIVGSSTLTPTDEVANSYISCGSCPR